MTSTARTRTEDRRSSGPGGERRRGSGLERALLGAYGERPAPWVRLRIGGAAKDPKTGHAARLRYLARVINEGVFTWEPAIMQLAGAPEALAFTPPVSALIGEP